MQRPPAPPAQAPFYTRRTVLAWSAVWVASLAVYDGVGHARDLTGVVAAVAVSVCIVTTVVAWAGGAVLAMRSGSFLMLIIVLVLGPMGAVVAALMTPSDRVGGAGMRR